MMTNQLQFVHDEVSKCNKCGFCQAHCPIYDITKNERSVARGHNAHVRKLIEGDLILNKDFKDPLFECLLCRSCVANCFPAVRTDKNVVAGRAEYLKRVGQPKLMKYLIHQLLPSHERLAGYVRLAAYGKNSRIGEFTKALGILKWFGKDFDKVEGIIQKLPTTFFRERIPELVLEAEQPTMRIAYFVGCGFNFVLPHVSEATVEMLVCHGAKVSVANNCCCGLPAYGYGDLEAAREMARKNIEVLEALDSDLVVTECGSCSAFLKEYNELFEDEPRMRDRAERLAKRVKAFSEFICDKPVSFDPATSAPVKVTYHDPCHMSRYQGIVKEPRAILKGLPGVEYVELPEADLCCGAAGTYNVLHYEQSMHILDRKMGHLKETGAEVLTTECPGCLIQLSYGVRRAGIPVRVVHIGQLLSEVYMKQREGRGGGPD